jgi:head-tail adaptor
MAKMPGVPIGSMRERVTPQKPTHSNVNGAATTTWADLTTTAIPACIQAAPATVSERIAGAAMRGVLGYLVEIRSLSTLTLECRLEWGTKYLAIRGMHEDRKFRRMVLACEEVT